MYENISCFVCIAYRKCLIIISNSFSTLIRILGVYLVFLMQYFLLVFFQFFCSFFCDYAFSFFCDYAFDELSHHKYYFSSLIVVLKNSYLQNSNRLIRLFSPLIFWALFPTLFVQIFYISFEFIKPFFTCIYFSL